MSASVSVLPSPVWSVKGPPISEVALRAGGIAIHTPEAISAASAKPIARDRNWPPGPENTPLGLAGLKVDLLRRPKLNSASADHRQSIDTGYRRPLAGARLRPWWSGNWNILW